MTKICSKCGVEKSLEEFHKDSQGKLGRKARCKDCIAQYMLDRKRLPGVKESIYQNGLRYDRENPEARMANSARERSRRDGTLCTITKNDIVIPDFCPILGIPLKRGDRTEHDSAPSLDRIIPENGYILGNVNVISYRANRLKNNGTSLEHRLISAWMTNLSHNSFAEDEQDLEKSRKEMLIASRRRAKKLTLAFDIQTDDIKIPYICPVLGIPLEPGKGRSSRHEGSPTLDRIDSDKGYVKGNIAVISYRANRIKNDGTAEEHLKIANWMDSMLQSTRIENNYEEESE